MSRSVFPYLFTSFAYDIGLVFSLLDDFAVYVDLILLVFIIRLMKNSITTGRVAVNNKMIVVRKATNEPYLIHTTIKCLS